MLLMNYITYIDKSLSFEQLTLKQHICFTLPNIAMALSSQTVSYYMMIYYTDVARLPLSYISILFLVCRIYDGLNDVFIGYFLTKFTKTMSMFRKSIIFSMLPLAVFSTLLFYTPNTTPIGKTFYALVVYLIWNSITSFLNIIMYSILPFVTRSAAARVKLNSWRIGSTILCILFISTFTMPIVSFLGKGNMQKGFFLNAMFFSSVGILIQIISYLGIRKTNIDMQENFESIRKYSIKESTLLIFKDKKLMMLLVSHGFFWFGVTFRNQSVVHYMYHVIGKPHFVPIFFSVSIIAPLLMQFSFKHLVKKFSMTNLCIIGTIGSLISSLLFHLCGSNFYLIILADFIFGIFSAIPANLIYIMCSEVTDDFNKKNKTNLSSFIFSFLHFFATFFSACASFTIASVLNIAKYNPSISATPSVKIAISFNFIDMTSIGLLISCIALFFYKEIQNKKSRAH